MDRCVAASVRSAGRGARLGRSWYKDVSGASAVVTIKKPGSLGRGLLASEQDHVVTNDHLIGFLK